MAPRRQVELGQRTLLERRGGMDEDVDHTDVGRRAPYIVGVSEIALPSVEDRGCVAGAVEVFDDRAPDRARAAGDERRSFNHGPDESGRSGMYR